MKKYVIILIVNELRNNLQNKCGNKNAKIKLGEALFAYLLCFYIRTITY